MTRFLVVTAVAAERDAVLGSRTPAIGMLDGLEVHRCSTPAGLLDVIVGGVGPVASAVSTCCALRNRYDVVFSAGIAGGFGLEPGAIAVADTVVHADLGAETPPGFTTMSELGWGAVRFALAAEFSAELAARSDACRGAILTVSTATGSRSRAELLRASHPDAVAEGMEGIGVYAAAARAGVSYGEIRAISNLVGPRDRGGWQIPAALTALAAAFDAVLSEPLATVEAA